MIKLSCFLTGTSQRNLYLSESTRADVGSLVRVGRHLPKLVGNLARVGRQFYQIKIADQHGSERVGIGRQKNANIRPDRLG